MSNLLYDRSVTPKKLNAASTPTAGQLVRVAADGVSFEGVGGAGSYEAEGSANTTNGSSTVTVLSVPVSTTLGGDGGAFFEVELIGVRQGTLETAAWKFRVRVKVASGALTVQSRIPLDWQDRDAGSGIAAATAALAASGGALNINVVGIAGSTIRWTAHARGTVRTQA